MSNELNEQGLSDVVLELNLGVLNGQEDDETGFCPLLVFSTIGYDSSIKYLDTVIWDSVNYNSFEDSETAIDFILDAILSINKRVKKITKSIKKFYAK